MNKHAQLMLEQFRAWNLPADPQSMRDKILRLEGEMLKREQVNIKTTHHFAPGIYAREIFIPKGTILTGKIHRLGHLNVLSLGDISVMTEHGIRRLIAPCTILSSAGIKRVGYAHEDSIWTTFHANPTDEQDLEKLESHFIVPSFDALESQTVIEDIV